MVMSNSNFSTFGKKVYQMLDKILYTCVAINNMEDVMENCIICGSTEFKIIYMSNVVLVLMNKTKNIKLTNLDR